MEEVSLKDKINQTLEEIRVVMPGSQALLGFQLVAVFSSGFESLSGDLKVLHFASLALITIATILLMAPSAYHRIAERGENTPRVHRIAGGFLVAAMAFLALGLAADIWLVSLIITDSTSFAWIAGLLTLLIASGVWLLFPISNRTQK